MKPCLVDVNVWLALLVRQHEHHALVGHWFANRSLMHDHAIPVSAGWDIVAKLLEDERVEFLAEPPGMDEVMPDLLRYRAPTAQLVSDSYLAAFAIASGLSLVTLDRGFRQSRGLDVNILRSEPEHD